MPTPKSLILLAMGVIAISNATADVTEPYQTHAVMKVATIAKMYEQDISNQGMDNPVVLQQYANSELQAAMQLEQDYFDKEQMSCHVGYDVLWDSQDPDYEQEKEFSITEQGLVKVSLAQGSNVYYDLSCDGMNKEIKCQVADVIMDEDGASLRKYLLETCR
ncbi:hypothetical protein [Psychrobacter sp. DAB_AL43B]|uniref:hypothetical protein n=1 Tax=Psychrobacter sp. DAB_AL43B TaxID=1028416 RepID=UPI0009A5A3C1|nr:hypothetical protein [Psychrobacter sp. DAB_AL43B]SLJ84653.1 hypothetical protein DABAL43B_1457 [Psychrobacter sp. DAB_AL43B]